jgi:cadmium resistance protein CadD (predicted permease)
MNIDDEELKLIQGIKPKLVVPICISLVCLAPNIRMFLYFMQNTGNLKMILTAGVNFFCIVILIVSWVNYVGAMDNYKDMLQKYHMHFVNDENKEVKSRE